VKEYDARALAHALRRHFGDVDIQHMSGRPDVIRGELRRWRRMKWLALPFTLPVYPDRLRTALLNGVHRVQGRRVPSLLRTPPSALDETSITIGPGLTPSLNLVAVARR